MSVETFALILLAVLTLTSIGTLLVVGVVAANTSRAAEELSRERIERELAERRAELAGAAEAAR